MVEPSSLEFYAEALALMGFLRNWLDRMLYAGSRHPRACDRLALDCALDLMRPEVRQKVEGQLAVIDAWQTTPDGKRTALYSRQRNRSGWSPEELIDADLSRADWPGRSRDSDGAHLFCTLRFSSRSQPSNVYSADVFFFGGRLFNIDWSANAHPISPSGLQLVEAAANPNSPLRRN